MDEGLRFRLSLFVFGSGLYAIRFYYMWMSGRTGGPVSRRLGQSGLFLISLVGLAATVAPVLYIVAPRLLAWAAVPLSQGVRWFGFGVGLLSDAMLFWVHRTLGKNYDMPGVIKERQTLVTGGPYRWVRHPMYTTFFLAGLATFLISANALIGVVFLIYCLTAASMAGMEEAALIEKFGERYRAYRAQTGRFLPRPGKMQPPAAQSGQP